MAEAPKSASRGVPRTLALELARVTERAAIAAARLRGQGDEKAALFRSFIKNPTM